LPKDVLRIPVDEKNINGNKACFIDFEDENLSLERKWFMTLLDEIKLTPPPTTSTGKEVKIKFINQVGTKYPVFLFFSNYPKNITESYKRFLEKLIRKHFGFYGVPFTLSFKEK